MVMNRLFAATVVILAFGATAFAAGPNGKQAKVNAGTGAPSTVETLPIHNVVTGRS
jgi:hypothetical protein